MKKSQRSKQIKGAIFGAALILLIIAWTFAFPGSVKNASAGDPDPVGAKKAFLEASQVLMSPRCLNCHPAADAPTVGDDSTPHRFNVKRGPEGKGQGGLVCTLCHKDTNQPDGRPGVPNWHMPPEHMPMIFQGRTVGELCRQLKDPKQNGGRTGEQVIDHLDHDPLVLWGWDPGKGRTAPKMSHGEFTAKMKEWLNKGGACPE